MQADALSQTFAALADPTRRAILKRLAAGPANVKELSRPFDMSGPAVCKHLRVLESAGIVHSAKSGRETHFALQPRSLEEAQRALAAVSEQWEAALARLKDFVEK